MFDIAIIGAGIAGASLAWRLAPQARVILLERESQPGYHSTGRSAAMFMETYGAPMVRALTRASRPLYEHPPAGFCDTPLLAPRGCLYVASPAQADSLTAFHASLTQAASDGISRLDRDQTLARVPVLRADQVLGAVLETDAQDIDVHALHQGFLRGARQAGCVLRAQSELLGAEADPKGWTLRLADGDTVRCVTVVNAAGAWADQVAVACGVAPVGLVPKRRSAFTFAPPAGLDSRHWPAVIDVDEAFYFKPDAGQLLGSPANADPTTPHDVQPEELDIATGIHHIETLTTMTIRRPSRTWAGLRSFVDDGELVIGRDQRRPEFFWLAAQGGYGIQTAAGASELAASMLLGQQLPDVLAAQGVDPLRMAPGRESR